MKTIAKLIGMISVLTLLVSCGGGGSASFTSGGGGDSTGGVVVNNVELLTSNSQLGSSGTNTVTLTAIVKDSSNIVVADVPVAFSANNNGSLQVVRGTTDSTGTAQATLSTSGDKDARTITVTATAGGKSDSVDISVTGTTISVTGASTLGFGEQGILTFTLKDSSGAGISGETLAIASNAGVNLSTNSVTTGASGQATVTVTGVSDPGSVTAMGAGATVTHDITVSSNSFTFTSPVANTEVDLGASQTVTVRLLNSGVGVDGVTVNFTATRGTLIASSAVTAGGGFATVSISATNAGSSLVTATTGSGLSTQLDLLFVATTPNSMTLQADPATIGVNPSGSPATQVSTITATVRDAANNLVKNQTVNFTLTDISGGSISPASAVTDASGHATTVYTAGASSSATDGVSITASIPSAVCPPSVTSCTADVTMTVAQQALFITLGTGNSITEPNATTYAYPYTVVVTDAGGAAVAGKAVNLSVIPTYYYKGELEWNGTSLWQPVSGTVQCANEDLDGDGFLDISVDDDTNNNGTLEPGNVAAVSPATVTTDSTGFASFIISYPQDHAYWVRVKLTARASVSGSEATNSATFDIPGLASDYSEEDTAPPGQFSPYGIVLDCASPD